MNLLLTEAQKEFIIKGFDLISCYTEEEINGLKKEDWHVVDNDIDPDETFIYSIMIKASNWYIDDISDYTLNKLKEVK